MNEFHLLSDYPEVSALSSSELPQHVRGASSVGLFWIRMSPNNDLRDSI